MTFYRTKGKRILDIVLCITTCLVFAPVMAILATLVHWKEGSPVIFRQRRAGLNGTNFELQKFRSMSNDCDLQGTLLPDEQRITSLGHFLRKASLDELPQLLNVLKGDMSLVGPRPLLLQYVDRYRPEHRRRLDVKPGITGWAQVHGRQDLPFSNRFEMDVWYVDHLTLWLDIRILAMTAMQVFRSRGVHTTQSIHDVDDLGLWR
jgi:sugar transferase EpsL